jgi:glycosyltransferase involved in cell wall biosynthesis
VCLQIAPRDWAAANTSGDLCLARALAGALRDQGFWTRLQVRGEVGDPRGAALDVAVHLRGRGRLQLPRGPRRVLWQISHPDEVTHDELADYDLVAVASRPHAAALADEVDVPVRELLQFTDPAVFRPADAEPQCHELLFVGNWRSVFRRAVWAVVPTAHNLGLYGQGWRYLAPEHARAEHVPNEQLHRLYSSADIVLADHWDDMRRHGFVSNRICDALACGAFVLCDDFPALHDLFAGGLETFTTPEDLRAKVERYLGDPEARAAVARRGRRLVLESHTAERRAAELLTLLTELDAAAPRCPTDAV